MRLIQVNPNNAIYYSEDFVKGFECGAKRQLEADIESAPTIGGWIPVTERLPEKHTRCLVTWKSLFGTLEIDTAKYGRMWLSERNGDGWYIHGDEMDTDITDDILAWMPLPEPYKGGGE